MSRRRKGGLPPGKVSLTGARKRLGITRWDLRDLVNAGEIPYHVIDGHSYIEEAVIEAIEARALDAAAELTAEGRRAELRSLQTVMTTAADRSSDKQVRQRTGLDDHLELGEYKPPPRKRRSPNLA